MEPTRPTVEISVIKEIPINSDIKGVILERTFNYTSVPKKSWFLLVCAVSKQKKLPFYTKLAELIYKRIETIYDSHKLSIFNSTVYGAHFLREVEKKHLADYEVYLGLDTYGSSRSGALLTLGFELGRMAREFINLGKQYSFNINNLNFVERIKG